MALRFSEDKKGQIALVSGAVFSKDPTQAFDFVSLYPGKVLGFLDLTDIEAYYVEGRRFLICLKGTRKKKLAALQFKIIKKRNCNGSAFFRIMINVPHAGVFPR